MTDIAIQVQILQVQVAVLQTKVELLLWLNAAVGIAVLGQLVQYVAGKLRNDRK